jgi:hypothetical protein
MVDWIQINTSKAARMLTLLSEHSVKLDFDGGGTCLPAIFEAARYGNLPVLKELLRLGVNVNARAGEHGNILHTAVSAEVHPFDHEDPGTNMHAACVATLLDLGLNINSSGDIYKNLLTAAVLAEGCFFGDPSHPALPLVDRGVKSLRTDRSYLSYLSLEAYPKLSNIYSEAAFPSTHR